VHVLDKNRKRLDDEAEKCIFLGVSESSKAYKLFNSMTKKVLSIATSFFMMRTLGSEHATT